MLRCKLSKQWHHTHLPQTVSTMIELQRERYFNSSSAFELLTTDYQTAGRGQRGTSWEADEGCNLLFGFVFHPTTLLATQQFLLSEALALSVRSALSVYAHDIMVKWPNDVYWHDKKICGMLLEHTLLGKHIATTLTGVGININQESFKSDAPNPISLYQIIGRKVSLEELLTHITIAFEKRYLLIKNERCNDLHLEYMNNLYRANGFHEYRDVQGVFKAQIEDISPMGILTLKKEDNTLQRYAFKEVSFVL